MARRRSLVPREHGAYAQLLAPLAAAVVVRAPRVAAALIAVGACLAFLANEPLLVVLGHRGERLRETEGARARRRLVIVGTAAAIAGGLGLALGGARTVAAAGLAALPAVALVVLAWRRGQHSGVGEIIAAFALPAAAAPVAIASGVAPGVALELWGAWSVGFAAAVVAVHRVIARHKRAAGTVDRVVGAAEVVALGALVIVAGWRPIAWLAVPLVTLAVGLVVRPPSASRLRVVGVALASAAAVGVAIAAGVARS